MTTEQLLIPRYKVIADYPRSKYNIGDILELPVKVLCTNCATGEKQLEYAQTHGDTESDFDSYPAIFRRMNWAEERKPEELPEYVKHVKSGFIEKIKAYERHNLILFAIVDTEGSNMRLIDYIEPSTEEAYLAQQKSQHHA